MVAIGELANADQPQIGLMHQGRSAERLARFLMRQLLSCEPAQLLVHKRQKLLGSMRTAFLDSFEDQSDIAHCRRV